MAKRGELKVGDRVKDLKYGDGTVKGVSDDGFIAFVKFDRLKSTTPVDQFKLIKLSRRDE